MEYLYGKLNKQVEQLEYKGGTTDTAQVEIDNSTNTIKVNVLNPALGKVPTDVIKKYLHRIKLTINSEDNVKSATLFMDCYSTESKPFTDCVFTTMENISDVIPVSGNICTVVTNDQNESVYYNNYAYMLSIIKDGDRYKFVINNSIEIETYLDYRNDWTIKDSVIGNIFYKKEISE